MGRIRDIHIVATIDGPDGPILVDCAARERDIEAEVLVYLREKANGITTDAILDEFERSDALGG
jgi:hypothetical protein